MSEQEDNKIKFLKQHYKSNYKILPDNYDTYIWHPRNTYACIYDSILKYSFIKLLNRNKIQINEYTKILDVGCGYGFKLSYFLQIGAQPDNLYGVDLEEGRIQRAKEVYPNIHFLNQDAQKLPFDDEYFDLTTEFVVLMAIRSERIKKNIAKEMVRVTKIGGYIISYDPKKQKDKSADTYGISIVNLKNYFSNCEIVDKIELYTRFTSRFAKKNPGLTWLSENWPFKTHHIVLLKRVK